MQFNESREPLIHPHEFATLKDIVLLTPEGFCRVNKVFYYNDEDTEQKELIKSTHPNIPNSNKVDSSEEKRGNKNHTVYKLVTKIKSLTKHTPTRYKLKEKKVPHAESQGSQE
ncbi:MAG: hypothetical protein FWB80_08090 [Defluviitaleaceae bacterium]|nr:hypothetical protein [Defluviitaleaceae bacterium]MCL2247031.1 hypothetical protein [Lentimicrobiaceae bacterium]